jgi:enoyl-CoA hydratase/carnithine racemase
MELTDSVEFVIDSGLAIVTLNRITRRNALDPDIVDSLIRAFRHAYANSEVRVVLLRARGPVFCAGMDLTELTRAETPDSRVLQRAIAGFSNLMRLITSGPKAVIAAVTGDLLAGGVGLAGACDIVYALDSVNVQLGEIIFGLIPANIMSPLVHRRISPGTYRRWALTAESVDARAAEDSGLFDGVYEDRAAMEKAVRAVAKRLYRSAPAAVARLKSLMDAAVQPGISQSRYARGTLFDLATDPGALDAIRAMNDGGVPAWFEKFKPSESLIPEE